MYMYYSANKTVVDTWVRSVHFFFAQNPHLWFRHDVAYIQELLCTGLFEMAGLLACLLKAMHSGPEIVHHGLEPFDLFHRTSP